MNKKKIDSLKKDLSKFKQNNKFLKLFRLKKEDKCLMNLVR